MIYRYSLNKTFFRTLNILKMAQTIKESYREIGLDLKQTENYSNSSIDLMNFVKYKPRDRDYLLNELNLKREVEPLSINQVEQSMEITFRCNLKTILSKFLFDFN